MCGRVNEGARSNLRHKPFNQKRKLFEKPKKRIKKGRFLQVFITFGQGAQKPFYTYFSNTSSVGTSFFNPESRVFSAGLFVLKKPAICRQANRGTPLTAFQTGTGA